MKAKQLTEGAKTELEKIRAIGRYVQDIQYISIQTNIGRGGGYRPRLATEVFAKSYGDCKDKANLMRSMLKVLGINSYLVSIYSGDPTFVRAEWPSPNQFNHCIIAVKVGDATQAATVALHPQLGRLLISNPTDENTRSATSRNHERTASRDRRQGVFRASADAGPPPESNRLERTAEVTLAGRRLDHGHRPRPRLGPQAVQCAAPSTGARARLLRPSSVGLGGGDGREARAGEPSDSHAEGASPSMSRSQPNATRSPCRIACVFKPAVVERGRSAWLVEPKRAHPVVIEPKPSANGALQAPRGFVVESCPTPSRSARTSGPTRPLRGQGRPARLHASLTQRASTIPRQYDDVRAFFGASSPAKTRRRALRK